MTNDLYSIKELMVSCAELGALAALKTLQPKSDDLTQRDAYKTYGEAWVKQCVRKDLVSKHRKGKAKNSPVYYSKLELTAVLKAEKLSQLGAFNNTNL